MAKNKSENKRMRLPWIFDRFSRTRICCWAQYLFYGVLRGVGPDKRLRPAFSSTALPLTVSEISANRLRYFLGHWLRLPTNSVRCIGPGGVSAVDNEHRGPDQHMTDIPRSAPMRVLSAPAAGHVPRPFRSSLAWVPAVVGH